MPPKKAANDMEHQLQPAEFSSSETERNLAPPEAQNNEETPEARLIQAHEQEALLARLQEKIMRRKFGYRVFSWLTISTYLLYWILAGLLVFYPPTYTTLDFVIGSLLACLIMIACMNTMRRLWGKSALEIGQIDDMRAVGILAETLRIGKRHKDIQHGVKISLTRLLPQLKASDAHFLNGEQRTCLYRQLKAGNIAKEADFLVAILTALEQVGDAQAIPYVEALVKSAPSNSPVAEAARNCLPYLQQNAHQQSNAETLLRAASNDVTDTLLRPVNGTVETAPEQLLRAADRDR